MGDGWIETNDENKKELNEDECLDLDDDVQAHVVADPVDDDDECVDLDDLEDGGDNIFASEQFVSKNAQDLTSIAQNPNLRKYDLSITYDYFH